MNPSYPIWLSILFSLLFGGCTGLVQVAENMKTTRLLAEQQRAEQLTRKPVEFANPLAWDCRGTHQVPNTVEPPPVPAYPSSPSYGGYGGYGGVPGYPPVAAQPAEPMIALEQCHVCVHDNPQGELVHLNGQDTTVDAQGAVILCKHRVIVQADRRR